MMTDEKQAKRTISTTISDELYELAKQKEIKLSDALAMGIRDIAENRTATNNSEVERLRMIISKMSDRLTEQAGRITQLEEYNLKTREE